MCCFKVSLDTHPTILVVGLVEVPLELPFKKSFEEKLSFFKAQMRQNWRTSNLRARYVTRPQYLSVATWLVSSVSET